MEQRISAGGLILHERKLLLVHHLQPGDFDFWLPPGGGVEGAEGLLQAARREVFEETNLHVQPQRIAYIEEFIDEGRYVCKFWVFCTLLGGELSTAHKDPGEPYLQAAGFFSQAEIQALNVFPRVLKQGFWEDLETGFREIKYLGYR